MGQSWYTLRSKTKREHVAAAGLHRLDDVQTFCPRLRFRRATRRGRVWFTEALFPGYLFARFDLRDRMREVQYAMGVTGLVHFGDRYPRVPDAAIEHLRAAMDEEETRVIDCAPEPGDEVDVLSGSLAGLRAVVTRVLPARQRVAVLVDFLGRTVQAELDLGAVTHPKRHPMGM
jgi:transcriptional antiterminator RfaH